MFIQYLDKWSNAPVLFHVGLEDRFTADSDGGDPGIRVSGRKMGSLFIFWGTQEECVHVLRLLAQAIRRGEQLFEVPTKESLADGSSREDDNTANVRQNQIRLFGIKIFRRSSKRRPS